MMPEVPAPRSRKPARTTVGSYRRLACDDGGTHFEISGEVPDAVLEAFAAGLGR